MMWRLYCVIVVVLAGASMANAGKIVRISHYALITASTSTEQEDTLFTIAEDGEVIVTDMVGSQLYHRFVIGEVAGGVEATSLWYNSVSGVLYIGTSAGDIMHCSIDEKMVRGKQRIFKGYPIGKMLAVKDEKVLVVSAGLGISFMNHIVLYDYGSERIQNRYELPVMVSDVRLSPVDGHIVVGGANGSLHEIDVGNGRVLKSKEIMTDKRLVLSDIQSNTVLIGDRYSTISRVRKVDLVTWDIDTTEYINMGTGFGLSADARLIYALDMRGFVVYDIDTKKEKYVITNNAFFQTSEVWESSNGHVTIRNELTVMSYDPSSMKPIAYLRHESGVIAHTRYSANTGALVMSNNVTDGIGVYIHIYSRGHNYPTKTFYFDEEGVISMSSNMDETKVLVCMPTYIRGKRVTRVVIIDVTTNSIELNKVVDEHYSVAAFMKQDEILFLDQDGEGVIVNQSDWAITGFADLDRNARGIKSESADYLLIQHSWGVVVVDRKTAKMLDYHPKSYIPELGNGRCMFLRSVSADRIELYDIDITRETGHSYFSSSDTILAVAQDGTTDHVIMATNRSIEVFGVMDSIPVSITKNSEGRIKKIYSDVVKEELVLIHEKNGFSVLHTDSMLTSIDYGSGRPEYETRYMSLYPNPSTGDLRMAFDVPKSGWVYVGIYDSFGYFVTFVFEGWKERGRQILSCDVSGITPGSYYVVCRTGGEQIVKSLKLVR